MPALGQFERFKKGLAKTAQIFNIHPWFGRKVDRRTEMAISGLLERFKKGLAKTAQLFNIRSWFGRKVDQAFLDDLEKRLIQADVGVAATGKLIGRVREAFADQTADENLLNFVKIELKGLLVDPRPGTLVVAPKPPSVYLIAGVNGSGKTTSIAKLAQHLKDQGKTILLAACDTFRAAAADQLSIWAARAGCEIVKGSPGADPASVAHDACQRALARHVDVLIVDTAGRLHTQTHLMRELEKIRNVIRATDSRLAPRSLARHRRHEWPKRDPSGRGFHQEHWLHRGDPYQARRYRQGRCRRRRASDHQPASQIRRHRRSPGRSPAI